MLSPQERRHFPLSLPPAAMRQRADILPILENFLRCYSAATDEASHDEGSNEKGGARRFRRRRNHNPVVADHIHNSSRVGFRVGPEKSFR